MAKLYKIEDQAGESVPRWFVTEKEARLTGGANTILSVHDFDEIELRQLATMWLNTSEIKRAAAIKREAAKTRDQATAIANKVWAKRRANGTDKRK